MTTVLRALQFSMNLGAFQGHVSNLKSGVDESNNMSVIANYQLKIPDIEVIGLFISFYKLLFLGSKFSKKMLKINLSKNDK